MAQLTARERRLIRGAAIVMVLYLFVFYGIKGVNWLDTKRTEHTQLTGELASLETQSLRELKKSKEFRDLQKRAGIDFATLSDEGLVTRSRNAIQSLAGRHSVGLSPIRESQGRSRAQLRQFQIDGKGSAKQVLGFLNELDSIGVPLVVDRVHVKRQKSPRKLEVQMTVSLLSFPEWKPKGAAGA